MKGITKKNKFYLTAAIPYVNAKPHIGHALEFVQTDAIKRYQKLLGKNSVSLSGGDENSLKNVQAAESQSIGVQDLVDKNTKIFYDLAVKLNAKFDYWQKGSDPAHHKASQKLWKLCEKDIYKKSYRGLYCVGCETFYTNEELNENGECFEHPGTKLEEVSEDNYFFKLSKYQPKLTKLIEKDTLKIVPEHRKKEVLAFLSQGLEDISISRSNKRAKNWGVKVPGDDTQRMYVWFDALNIYQSGLGFGSDNEDTYDTLWPADLHVIGKGILRFHAVYWPVFLLSANIPLPKKLFVHDYFTVNGQKMSKTLGNVIDPMDLINKYAADPLRYYFLAKFSPFSDGDFSEEKFIECYNADLANGLGNLVARIATLSEKANLKGLKLQKKLDKQFTQEMDNFRFDLALAFLWEKLKKLDQKLNSEKPWEISDKEKLNQVIKVYAQSLLDLSWQLTPFLPETAKKIQNLFTDEFITKKEALFPRLK